MDVTGTMTAPPPVPAKSQGRDTSQVARQTVSIRTVTTPSTMPVTTGSGATVFVGLGAPAGDSAPAACRRRVPEVQTRNGHAKQSSSESQSQQQQQLQLQLQLQQPSQQQQQQAAHVVKIKINPDSDKNGRVISTVRLTLDEKVDHEIENGIILPCEHSGNRDGCKVVSATNLVNEEHCTSGGGEGCVRISVVGNGPRSAENRNEKDMVHRGSPDTLNSSNSLNRSNNNNTCFYYNNYQSSLTGMVMSSGQCSPSDTLDSGTCSDLDGTPPPLPKKKNNNKVILGTGQHNRTGSLTSSGAEVDSDDNESNISCDSLNGVDLNGQIIPRKVNGTVTNGDLQAKAVELEVNGDRTTGITEEIVNLDRLELSNNDKEDTVDKLEEPEVQPITGKASESVESSLLKTSTPTRVRSPDSSSDQNGRLAPVVKECTYEERKQERIDQQEIISETSEGSVNPLTGKKYLYEYDRYYKFHMNELKGNNKDTARGLVLGDNETDECFAGYKILDKEAIRSAKGTVRGVKNRVRAGIATFLQKPSSQAYIKKELGKVVVYTTTSGIVRKTFYNCKKVKQILRTHMVKYDELDLFGDAELQAELRERLGSTVIQLPQLFIDGQHIGGFDTVERLNESGKLRDMLKPYQSEDACTVCLFCGGYQWQLCPVCNGSKRSVHRNDFTAEFVALKCARCDVNGLIRCPHC